MNYVARSAEARRHYIEKITHTSDFAAYVLEARYSLITIVGASGTGKSKAANAMMLEIISRGGYLFPDEFRYQFRSAPQAFEDAKRTAYGSDSRDDIDILSNAQFLVLDDFDKVDMKQREMATRILTQRTDSGKMFTILTVTDMRTLKMFGSSIDRRVREGRVVAL